MGSFFPALIENFAHPDATEIYSPREQAAKIVGLEKIRRDDTKSK